MENLFKYLKTIWTTIFNPETILEIILHPELHKRELPVLLSATVMLILVLVLTIIIIYQRQRPVEIAPEERLRLALIGLISSMIIFIITSSVPTLYLISKENCARCHQKEKHLAEFEIVHRNIPCASCHTQGGLIGDIDNYFKVAGKIYNVISNEPVKKYFYISNENCLKCHFKITSSLSIRNRIIVRHKEIIDTGQPCVSCHPATDEGKRLMTSQRIMAACGKCHNEKTASAKCNICHTPLGNPPLGQPDLSNFPRVTITGENPLIESTETTDIQAYR